uniref:Uncharacterized protein n=1 Tax=Caldimicrobium thiodismutans TaxID=1653476 RepID=A0A832GNY4_9BACT
MNPPQLFLRFLPFWLVFLFLKGVLTGLIPLWYVDPTTALSLAFTLIWKFNLWALVGMLLLGLIRAFDGVYPLLFFASYYSALLWLRNWGKRYFKEQSAYFPYLFWALAILILVFLELFLFFNRLSLYSLTYDFLLRLLLKSLFYALFTFLLTIAFYRLLKVIWDHES